MLDIDYMYNIAPFIQVLVQLFFPHHTSQHI